MRVVDPQCWHCGEALKYGVRSTLHLHTTPAPTPIIPSHPNVCRWSNFELEARSARSCGLYLSICRRRWRPSLVDCAPPWWQVCSASGMRMSGYMEGGSASYGFAVWIISRHVFPRQRFCEGARSREPPRSSLFCCCGSIRRLGL